MFLIFLSKKKVFNVLIDFLCPSLQWVIHLNILHGLKKRINQRENIKYNWCNNFQTIR